MIREGLFAHRVPEAMPSRHVLAVGVALDQFHDVRGEHDPHRFRGFRRAMDGEGAGQVADVVVRLLALQLEAETVKGRASEYMRFGEYEYMLRLKEFKGEKLWTYIRFKGRKLYSIKALLLIPV